MNELDAQRLVIESVHSHGGFAVKLSHRFMVGVSDLLVQIPDLPTGLWEVKMDDLPKQNDYVQLKPTAKQVRFLEKFKKAGGHSGLISFVRTRNSLSVWIRAMENVPAGMKIPVTSYTILERGQRGHMIFNLLKEATYG